MPGRSCLSKGVSRELSPFSCRSVARTLELTALPTSIFLPNLHPTEDPYIVRVEVQCGPIMAHAPQSTAQYTHKSGLYRVHASLMLHGHYNVCTMWPILLFAYAAVAFLLYGCQYVLPDTQIHTKNPASWVTGNLQHIYNILMTPTRLLDRLFFCTSCSPFQDGRVELGGVTNSCYYEHISPLRPRRRPW